MRAPSPWAWSRQDPQQDRDEVFGQRTATPANTGSRRANTAHSLPRAQHGARSTRTSSKIPQFCRKKTRRPWSSHDTMIRQSQNHGSGAQLRVSASARHACEKQMVAKHCVFRSRTLVCRPCQGFFYGVQRWILLGEIPAGEISTGELRCVLLRARSCWQHCFRPPTRALRRTQHRRVWC